MRLTAEDRPRRDHHDDRVARGRAARNRRAGAFLLCGLALPGDGHCHDRMVATRVPDGGHADQAAY